MHILKDCFHGVKERCGLISHAKYNTNMYILSLKMGQRVSSDHRAVAMLYLLKIVASADDGHSLLLSYIFIVVLSTCQKWVVIYYFNKYTKNVLNSFILSAPRCIKYSDDVMSSESLQYVPVVDMKGTLHTYIFF